MASVVDIWNAALDLVGVEEALTSAADESIDAERCRRAYPIARDTVIRGYPWNCCLRRASLAADAGTPDWGFDWRYALPEGPDEPWPYCLRVYRIRDQLDYDDLAYRVEGRFILTDEGSPLEIQYIARVDPGQFDVMLADAIAHSMAMRMAPKYVDSATRVQVLGQAFDRIISQARRSDAMEGSPEVSTRSSTWAMARFTGGAGRP